MTRFLKSWIGAHPRARWVYPAAAVSLAAVSTATAVTGRGGRWLYIGFIGLILFALRPNSALHGVSVERAGAGSAIAAVLAFSTVTSACLAPMDDLPLWNGQLPEHRNQYELMAEAILDGRVDIVYGDEEELLRLRNPYDPEERESSGVRYHWDHAFYKGHYYMYFGIAPVLLLFLPYRAVTGRSLATFRATQIFTALAIAGIFALFWLLARRFFKGLPVSVYIALSSSLSAMSLWYASAEPALYCTAITSALALEIWSLYFFVRAVWWERRENRQIFFAFLGALLGAAAFACRPPIALANILVIPMLAAFLKGRKFTPRLCGKLCLAALPYLAVAAGLMWYNYIRFENPFEFGQKYQLTVADQSKYGLVLSAEAVVRVLAGTLDSFFDVGAISAEFPYLTPTSVFFNFPILLLLPVLALGGAARGLRREGMLAVVWGAAAVAVIITGVDVLWTPYILERYRMDVYFLLAIGYFIALGFRHGSLEKRPAARLSFAASALSLMTVISSFLLYVRTLGVYYPEMCGEIGWLLGLE